MTSDANPEQTLTLRTEPVELYKILKFGGFASSGAEAKIRIDEGEVTVNGGWAVVSTEETEIHPTSDISPFPEQRLWDERDIPALKLMTDAVHEKGALAAIELAHNGNHAGNLYSRATPLGVTDMQVDIGYPKQARRILKKEIKALRQWHRGAALRAKQAGFDVIYVYAGHRMTLAHQFLLPDMNTRTDEYGGSLENRARLLKELLIDM